MTADLFESVFDPRPSLEAMADGAVLLRGFAKPLEHELFAALKEIVAQAPFRRMFTPGGHHMSVAMTNCGNAGWVTDRNGYRYDGADPESGKPWPPMPACFRELARRAAAEGGFGGFAPDACLINRYEPGAKMSLHQDRNERDMDAPVVSISLGIPAMFQFGGEQRGDKTQRVPLFHGDIVVWGGPDRLRYHGILPIKPAQHPLLGNCRINMTFRKAG